MRTVGYIPSETEAAETTNAGGKPPIPEGGGTGTSGNGKTHTPQGSKTSGKED